MNVWSIEKKARRYYVWQGTSSNHRIRCKAARRTLWGAKRALRQEVRKAQNPPTSTIVYQETV